MRLAVVSAALSALMALAGCREAPVLSVQAQELAFISPYMFNLERACGSFGENTAADDRIELVFHGYRPQGSRKTTDSADWDLSGCGRTLTFKLDCDGACAAREWPIPEHVARRRYEDRELEILLAVLEKAPICSESDGSEGLRIHVGAKSREEGSVGRRFQIERCGVIRNVRVTCTEWARCTGTLTDSSAPN